jgi:hypothetical protein
MDETARASRTRDRAFRAGLAAAAILLACPPLAAQELVPIPEQAPICKTVEPVIEWLRLIKTTSGSEPSLYMQAETEKGECHVATPTTQARVVDVDQRGFALVEEEGQPGQWWVDARDVWGYDEAEAKLKAWKKP